MSRKERTENQRSKKSRESRGRGGPRMKGQRLRERTWLSVSIMWWNGNRRTGPFALAPPLAVGKRYLGQVPFGYASSSGWWLLLAPFTKFARGRHTTRDLVPQPLGGNRCDLIEETLVGAEGQFDLFVFGMWSGTAAAVGHFGKARHFPSPSFPICDSSSVIALTVWISTMLVSLDCVVSRASRAPPLVLICDDRLF